MMYRPIYRAVFEYHMPHLPVLHTSEYWEYVYDDAAKTANASGNNPLLVSLLQAVIDELERL